MRITPPAFLNNTTAISNTSWIWGSKKFTTANVVCGILSVDWVMNNYCKIPRSILFSLSQVLVALLLNYQLKFSYQSHCHGPPPVWLLPDSINLPFRGDPEVDAVWWGPYLQKHVVLMIQEWCHDLITVTTTFRALIALNAESPPPDYLFVWLFSACSRLNHSCVLASNWQNHDCHWEYKMAGFRHGQW